MARKVSGGWTGRSTSGLRWSAARAYLDPREGPQEPDDLDPFLGRAHPLRGPAGRRRASCRGRAARLEVRARREVVLAGGAINSPQLLMLSGIGPGRRTAAPRHSGRGRPAGGRRQPAGPSRGLFPGGQQGADHALFSSLGLVPKAMIGARMAADEAGARRHQPFRELRLHPQPARRALAGPAIPFPAGRHLLQRQGSRDPARLPGPCRADALEEPRAHLAALRRPARKARDPLQLHEPSGRLDRVPRRDPADARDLRPAGLRPLPGRGTPARRRGHERRGDRRLHQAARRKRLSSRARPARWARWTIPTRS